VVSIASWCWLTTGGEAGENAFAEIGAGGKGRRSLKLVTGLDTARDGLESIRGATAGELQIATTKNEVPSFLAPHHVYVIVNYDPARAEVALFNPLGVKGKNKVIKYGRFTISRTEFWADFRNIDHVTRSVQGQSMTAGLTPAAKTNADESTPSGAASSASVR
jgi:hypothetical protein